MERNRAAEGQIMRRCWKCNTEKPITRFYGGQYKCIACDKEYYIENRVRILRVKREWFVKNRDQRAAYLSRIKREQIL